MRKYKNIKDCIKEINEIKEFDEIEVEEIIKINDPKINFIVVILLNKGIKIINDNFKIYKEKSRLVDYLIYQSTNGGKDYIRQVLKGENNV